MTDLKVTFMLIFIFTVLFLDSTVVFVDDSQLIHMGDRGSWGWEAHL